MAATDSAKPSLSTLPEEIIASIVSYLEIPSLLALNATSRRFTAITDDPRLWKTFCQSHFQYWDDRAQFQQWLANDNPVPYNSQPAEAGSDPLQPSSRWKQLYQQRTLNFRSVNTVLKSLINEPVNRCDNIQVIADHGYQAKDALIRAFHEAKESRDYLAQKYWSHVTLGCLHRKLALDEWTKIRFRTDIKDATERALAAMDLFVIGESRVGDIDDIFDRLNSYVESVRQAYPDIDEQTPRQRAINIASHLRHNKWVGMQNMRTFHCVDHIFLGIALFRSTNGSLPLISCVIYSYVCRRFGLQAQPCNYPQHVHAVVQAPPGFDLDGNPLLESSTPTSHDRPREPVHMFMDPFNADQPTPIADLEVRIRFVAPHFTQEQRERSFLPVSAREMVIRTASNILYHTASHSVPPVSSLAATYGAHFALCTFPEEPDALHEHLVHLTQAFLHNFDHDLRLFRQHVLPLTRTMPNHHAYRNLLARLSQADSEQPVPKIRPTAHSSEIPGSFPQPQPLKYKVGQVFRHKRQGYTAVVYGWDTNCAMPDQWIYMNRVDDLTQGRHQPFYNAFVADDGSTRYVAEENIILVGRAGGYSDGVGIGAPLTEQDVDQFGIEIGKWFKRFDYDTGCFVSNVRYEYPDD